MLNFRLTGSQHFRRLDVPFAMPGRIWNAMMSGGWSFAVASEFNSVGKTSDDAPAPGSYVTVAI